MKLFFEVVNGLTAVLDISLYESIQSEVGIRSGLCPFLHSASDFGKNPRYKRFVALCDTWITVHAYHIMSEMILNFISSEIV